MPQIPRFAHQRFSLDPSAAPSFHAVAQEPLATQQRGLDHAFGFPPMEKHAMPATLAGFLIGAVPPSLPQRSWEVAGATPAPHVRA